jgi:hypothetical protein
MMLTQAVVVTPDFTAQTEVPLFRHRFTIKGHVCFRAAVLRRTQFLRSVSLGCETTPVLRLSEITVRAKLSSIGNPVYRAAEEASRDGGLS